MSRLPARIIKKKRERVHVHRHTRKQMHLVCACVHTCTHTHVLTSAYAHREHSHRQEKALEPQENIASNSMPIDAETWMKWVYLPEKRITESNWSS